uniref:phosphoserine transaminase n=1 Tax=Tetradesmus obliquus TaxID=3088 RepID=A0A383WER3_TETOB|eukprot:jgi/Sobl393_1/19383/SZX76105.1
MAAHGRVFNFSAGPAMLPLEVLEQTQRDTLNFNGSGMSVMEMSHRSKAFEGIIKQAEADLRTLLSIPDNYKVLFVQGGASTQFAAIPLNFTQEGDTVDYIVTGAWSKKAYEEAAKFGLNANVVAKGDNKSVPARDSWKLSPDAKYVHYCDNETIGGVEFQGAPDVGDVPLIADMSSNFLSKPVDVSKYAMIYAGAQKNVGPSGVVIAIVREDLLGKARPSCPTMLNYAIAAENGSMYNTPPCWPIYVCGLVFQHLLKLGGLAGARERNVKKAQLLYDTIAGSNGFYFSPVEESVRSKMNVPFTIPSKPELEKAFVAEATAAQLLELKGHRSVGGMRASIYNAMPHEGVEALTKFMTEFQAKNA